MSQDESVSRRAASTLALVLLFSLWSAQADGQEYRTPLAGESFHTEVFGEHVNVPGRDRRSVTAANFGIMWIPNGPTFLELLPFGSLFLWRNWDDGYHRFRATIAAAVNDINYNIGSRHLKGLELVMTFDNIIIPLGRPEYVEGQRIQDVEVEWNYVFAGFGLGYRRLLPPWHQDNAIEVSLTYEPGYRWFRRAGGSSPQFGVPTDTYEGRVHARLRVDTIERNVMELPHRGYALGADGVYGHRSHWGPWGGVAFPSPDVSRERDYLLMSAYAFLAGPVPFVHSDRHRLISSGYMGIGKDLDRFSAFRLPGRPTGYEWEALSLPILPGVAFNELFPRRYYIANVQYRYEALFFLYPYVRGTWGLVERPRFGPNREIRFQMDTLPAVSGGLISGAPWHSQIELNYSYNFGIFRDPRGMPSLGGHGFFMMWAKEL